MTDSKEGATNKVEYDANVNDVSAVTVFQANRAEVKRWIKVDLKEGQNDVEVLNLPTCLEESSIRVDGIGNAIIFDVIYHPSPPVDYSKRKDALNDLEARQKSVLSEIGIVTRQADVLSDYSKTLSGKDTTAEQLGSFLDVYAARQAKLDDKKSKLQAALDDVQKEIQLKSVSFNVDAESIVKRGVRITVVVLAETAGPAELSLTYLVSHASWTPQYDLRATIAPDAKSESSVVVHYRASISQKTGENWTGVELTLSTASPLQGTTIPSLNPLWISEKPQYHPTSMKKSKRATLSMSVPSIRRDESSASSATVGYEMERGGAMFAAPFIPPPLPATLAYNDSNATEGAVSATFTIPGLSTIPSDSDTSQQTHRVSVAELPFSDVGLEWITVPKDGETAFLRCKVKNTSKYLLLPGQANVFLNGNFVSKSKIPHVSPQESFSCSLGVDPALRVTYHPQSKKTKSSGGSVLTPLSAKTSTTVYEQVISIKNTRLSSVHRLLLKEQIPVSRDSRFKVNLIEPRALASANKNGKSTGDAVAVAEGIKVQWASRNEEEDENLNSKVPREERTVDSAQGLMDWIISIEPSASIDVNLAWEVVAPHGVEWVSGNY